jgi:hypothetical protein
VLLVVRLEPEGIGRGESGVHFARFTGMTHLLKRCGPAIVLAICVASASPAQGQSASPPKPDELDRLLASVALYPDQLLAQILLCAAAPADVRAINGWLATTTALKGTERQDAATKAGFDPACVALVLFPQTLQMMSDQIDWTTRVGKAFAAYRADVFASIQRLRSKARQAGTLKSTAQQDVETRTTTAGQEVIVIEPANPQVVYVPQYNPTVVYTQPTTVVVHENSSGDAAAAALVGFTAGIAIGAAVDNNYYYGPYGWHGGAYMYNDAWDDMYDAREDAREDWSDHRQDMAEERGDRAGNQQEQRTERQANRQENRPESQTRATSQQSRSTSEESRGYSGNTDRTKARTEQPAARERSGTQSDAFSGYSSGRSERAASTRGNTSRGSSRRSSGGGGRRR